MHAIMMVSSVGFVFQFGICSARYGQGPLGGLWYLAHRVLNIAGWLTAFAVCKLHFSMYLSNRVLFWVFFLRVPFGVMLTTLMLLLAFSSLYDIYIVFPNELFRSFLSFNQFMDSCVLADLLHGEVAGKLFTSIYLFIHSPSTCFSK